MQKLTIPQYNSDKKITIDIYNSNHSCLIEPKNINTYLEDVSFCSDNINNKNSRKSIEKSDSFQRKWVLNKLIEMNFDEVEEIHRKLSEIKHSEQSKEELLELCLDIITNQSEKYLENNNIENVFKESKNFLNKSFQSLMTIREVSTKKFEFISKSLNISKESNQSNFKSDKLNKAIENTSNIRISKIQNKISSNNEEISHKEKFKFQEKSENESNLIIFSEQSILDICKNERPLNDEISNISNKSEKISIKKGNFNEILYNDYIMIKPNYSEKNIDIKNENTEFYDFHSDENLRITKNEKNNSKKKKKILLKTNDIPIKQQKEIPLNTEKNAELKSCDICYDVLPFLKQVQAGKCQDIFCKQCLISHFEECICSGRVISIPCPKEGCSYKYNDEEIKTILANDPDLIKKYERFKLQIFLAKDPSIRWCIRPNCNNYFKGSSAQPKLQCICGEVICFNCSKKWHEGKTCIEVMDKEYETYKQKNNIMNCPKCFSRIEKAAGCNHMTCTRCRHEFCWICGKKYSKRHYKKYNIFGCPGMMHQTFVRSQHFERQRLNAKLMILLRLICIIFLIILFPLIGIGLLILLPNLIYYHDNRFHFEWKDFFRVFLLFVFGIIILPITIALAIVPGSCIALISLFK